MTGAGGRVVLYERPGCPFCLRLRVGLRLGRVPFEAVDIWSDAEAAAAVRAVNRGDELVPTVRVGGTWLSNPSVREVRRARRAAG